MRIDKYLIFILFVSAVMVSLVACAGEDPPALEVISAQDLGPLEVSAAISGRDGGYSALAWGRSAWVFGDTVLTIPDQDGGQWHTNSVSWTEDLAGADGVTGFVEPLDRAGAPARLLNLTMEEEAYAVAQADVDGARWALWPGAVVFDAARSRALVFYAKVHTRPVAFDFYVQSKGIAEWSALEEPARRAEGGLVGEEPLTFFGADEPPIGDAAVVVGELLYAYGCVDPDKECVVGRVELSRALERDQWRFWSGGAWVEDARRAAPVLEAHNIVSVHQEGGVFVAVYSEPLSDRVLYRTAPAPQGPWSGAGVALTAQAPLDGLVSYSAVAHPEVSPPGQLLITYHRGLAPFRSELRQALVTWGAAR